MCSLNRLCKKQDSADIFTLVVKLIKGTRTFGSVTEIKNFTSPDPLPIHLFQQTKRELGEPEGAERDTYPTLGT